MSTIYRAYETHHIYPTRNQRKVSILDTDCPEFTQFVKEFNAKEKFMTISHYDYYNDGITTHVDIDKKFSDV